jgi:hypothetical protein
MSEIADFLKENSQMIMLIVIVVLGLLVIINIKGIDLNPPKPESKLVQEITVETLDMLNGASMQDSKENIEKMKLSPSNSFCESYLGNSQELEGGCNQLTESNCAQTSCCVFTKTGENSKCVAGSLDGPTYKTDKDGKLITMDSYYYLGKCRGQCPT